MRDARLERDFGDGRHTFRLGWGEMVKLQEETDHGPLLIAENLASADAKPEWAATVIRLGLIGGGMEPATALKMVRSYVEPYPLQPSARLAAEIALAGWQGAPDETIELKGGGEVLDDLPNGKLRFASMYGIGAVMGFTPQEIDAMSVWQFMATVDGFQRAHDVNGDKKLSETQANELFDWVSGAN